MSRSIIFFIGLFSFVACTSHSPPTATTTDTSIAERTAPKPLSRVEAEIADAGSIPDLVDSGMKAYQDNRYHDAIQIFQEVLKTKPDDHPVRYNLGLAYYQQKRYKEAIEAFEYIVSRMNYVDRDLYLLFYPTLLKDARINLGMSHLQEGSLRKAIEALLEAMPDETAHYNLIVAYNRMGNLRRVTALANEYIELYGEDADIYNVLGLTYYRQERYEQALDAFEKAVENRAADAELQMNLGLIYMQLERNEEAEAAFEKAQRLNPKLDPSEYLEYLQHFHEREARIQYNRGNQLQADGDIDAAIAAFEQAVELHPEFVEAHINLGVAYGEKHQSARGIKHLERASALDPDAFEAFYNLGIAYANAKRYSKAAATFGRAVELKPGHARAQYNLGIVRYKNRQPQEAIAPLQKAIELSPTWIQPRMDLGLLLGDLGRFNEAIEVFKALLEHDYRNSDAYYNLGSLYLEIDDRENAIAAFANAVRYNPRHQRAQAMLDGLR